MTRGLLSLLALVLVGQAAGSVAEAGPRKGRASKKKHRRLVAQRWISHPAEATDTPAYRYGQMDQEACEAELTARAIPFERVEARGVLAPVRILGPLHGVTFRTNLSEERRATTPWEIGDCRLALALSDFAQILARHDIVDVRHYSMYRPPSKRWPDEKFATQHNGATAIDAARFITSDGRAYDVLDDFHGRINAKTCGEGAAPRKRTPAALELRAILCETVAANLFNIVLTPNFNRAHKNHFHLEITGAGWFLVH